MKILLEVFSLIATLKEIKREKIMVTYEEQKLIHRNFYIYRMNHHISYKKFRDAVIMAMIDGVCDVETAIKAVAKEKISKL